jgi:hypothetical protein
VLLWFACFRVAGDFEWTTQAINTLMCGSQANATLTRFRYPFCHTESRSRHLSVVVLPHATLDALVRADDEIERIIREKRRAYVRPEQATET